MKARNWLVSFLTLALATGILAAATFAQVGTATVTGTVTDQQGNSVVGATVKLIGNQGTSRTAVTNSNGVYQFPSTQTGTYKIEVEMTGFKRASVSNFQALTDIATEMNVKLEIGQVTETVNVDAAGLESIVNTQDASLGNNFVSRQILTLPLEGRNVAGLLSLQAGVTPDGSVFGGRADQANLTLDGIDVNNQQQGLDIVESTAFAPVLRVNPDSVDEFRVTTSNPDASKGRSSGAQVSLITKSGTNDFHGALYEYHRNTVTTANDWFSNAAGSFGPNDLDVRLGKAKVGDPVHPRPQLLRNLFGGRLGGPIVKDRLFFFYNYEGMREAKSKPVAAITVPTASLAAGNIRFFDNTGLAWNITTAQINSFVQGGNPVVDVNPAVTSLLTQAVSRYRVNDPRAGDGLNTGGYSFNTPMPVEQNAHTARFDWSVTRDQKHQVSLRGNYQQDITGLGSYYPDTPPTNTWSHPLGFAATYTWLIKSNLTNRFSYGLTRLAYSNQGDSADPAISFRYIFQPNGFTRAFNRTNPTTNITDDLTWIKGNHTFQFGTNIRFIKNTRVNFADAFDRGSTNPSYYQANLARTILNSYMVSVAGTGHSLSQTAWDIPAQGALVALLGRLNDYGANINFDTAGKVLPANTGIEREFKTDEYDWYVQDTWKWKPNITLTAGLRYGLSMPVTETNGYETVPSIPLSTYLDSTAAAMQNGQNYREPLSVRLAGKANGLDSMYPLDKNNFQPRVSLAWSPDFETGFLSKVFGKNSESVFRGGFSITNDYFGQQLATNWDGGNTLGFSSASDVNANRYNLTTNPGPMYTGPSMSIRNLPNLIIPTSLTFPQTPPFNAPGSGKIETSLDQNLVSPINYSWNVSYGRRLAKNMWIDVGYVGRLARHLLIGRDAMMLRGDIRDPRSGQTYNEAATLLDIGLQNRTPVSQIPNNPFWDNMWAPTSLGPLIGCPTGMSTCTNTQAVYTAQPFAGDWTYFMQTLDEASGSRYFFQGQYDALSTFATAGSSDYHGATVSIRQRTAGLIWDFNYTYSKSLDQASGLQSGGLFGSAFVLNAFKLNDQRSYSDFDARHLFNFNGVWDIPVGHDRAYGKGMNKFVNALIGGWSLSGIFRADSGFPFDGFYDATGWQTNWNIRSYETLERPIQTGNNFGVAASTCTLGCSLPNLFTNPDAAWDSFRNPHPGETGTRNPIRLPNTYNLDAGLSKSFDMPWKEGHKISIRWDVFNVTNTAYFGGQPSTRLDSMSAPTDTFGRFTEMRNTPRVMQFAFRYDF